MIQQFVNVLNQSHTVDIIIIALLLIIAFLSLSGFSCAYYRFKNTIVLSQSRIYHLINQVLRIIQHQHFVHYQLKKYNIGGYHG